MNSAPLKLNVKKTVLVGLAFFLIMAFWQAYDTIVPKILTEKFGMAHWLSGVIMALDNILALFLLPFFGALSDKCKSKRGKRTPFILIGTLLSCLAIVGIIFADGVQSSSLEAVDPRNPTALETLYEADHEIRVEGEKGALSSFIEKEAFLALDDPEAQDYTTYVVAARSAYAKEHTKSHPAPLIFFVLTLFFVLLAMGIFRSPAVALMPDVTPKPLRSKGNAVINLLGACGTVSLIGIGMLFGTGKAENAIRTYGGYFAALAGVMLIALLVFLLTVKEPRWAREAEEQNRLLEDGGEEAPAEGTRALSKGEKRSLILLLASVALWYMGFNAVTTKFSVYAAPELNMDFNSAMLVAQIAGLASFLPAGMIASKIGRKKSILIGVGMLGSAMAVMAFVGKQTPAFLPIACFIIAGLGWGMINVNSFPMVVELATGGNVGKYTGYYYTASMAAQTLTPVLSGALMDLNMRTLFPYSALFVALSFLTMLFVKHGDSKPVSKKSVLEQMDVGD
ncbi:MAG: MFS transporter [Clostridia bacterium]|nr:MFS transporter [Clostridia bacterium]